MRRSYGCEPNLSGLPGGAAGAQGSTAGGGPGSGPAASASGSGAASAGNAGGANRQGTPARAGSGTGGGTGGQAAAGYEGDLGAGAAGVNPRTAARLRVRMLPYLLGRMSATWSFPKCNFRIRKAKLGAARVVVHRELGCAGSYTLEASLGGCAATRTHFSAADYISMGMELCR